MFVFRKYFLLMVFSAMIAVSSVTTPVNAEVRGAWITAWTSGFFNAKEVDATIAAAKKAQLNTLFIQVRKNADSYYNSETEPRGGGIASNFDPLACVIAKAGSEDIKVHAWVNTFRIWAAQTPPSDPKHIVNRHPEWVNKKYDGAERASEGLYLDPGIPEVRDYIVSVIEEISKKYNVDGIHLDYIRYPGKDWGYSDLALSQYYKDTGTSKKPDPSDPSWLAWKRNNVTELVKLTHKKVKAIRPDIQVTTATIPWGDCPDDFRKSTPYTLVSQDWKQWMSEGIIDANIPMNYKVESNKTTSKQFRNWLDGFKKWDSGKPVYVGISVYDNKTSDSIKQIDAVRKKGLAGFVLFQFNESEKRDALVQALSKK